MAVAEDYLRKNPALLLFTPREAKRNAKAVMTRQEVKLLFSTLGERELLICMLATIAGMRPGEIFGLKWQHVETDHVNVEQRVYRRQVGGALHFPRGFGRLLPNGENSLEIPVSPFSQTPFATPRVKRKREPADKAFRVVAPARDALREGRSRLRF